MVIVSVCSISVNVNKSHAVLPLLAYPAALAIAKTSAWITAVWIVSGALAYKGLEKLDNLYEENKAVGKMLDAVLKNPMNFHARHPEWDPYLGELEEQFIDIAETLRNDYWDWNKEHLESDYEEFGPWNKYKELFQLMIYEGMPTKTIFEEGIKNGNKIYSTN